MAPSTYLKLQNKHILIIGGSSGIGYAVADGSLASKAKVTISSSSQTKIDAAITNLKSHYSSIQGFAFDLSDPSTLETNLESLFKTASQSTHGQINHVVFTAADSLTITDLNTLTPSIIHQASQMRFIAPLIVAKVAAHYLPKTTASSIVFTTGCVAEKPTAGWSLISFFAGGLSSLVKGLAVDLAPVRVNAVRAGYVDTPLWPEDQKKFMKDVLKEKSLIGKFGRVEDVAEAYLWLLKDENVTGSAAGSDGGVLLV
ncbi:short chain dehydrogenase [Podospora fimiseda]|uniref:Short chain dehydrogenase n=1 Tax=Podospora fimiseda TaxID=252190 RepID=A0AAN6YR15_9PEZI|nr:short chain dehydrogenase [Podospora fimiseda]